MELDKHFRNVSVLAFVFLALLYPAHGVFAQLQSSRSGLPGLRIENARPSTTFWFLRQERAIFSAQGYYPGSLMNYAPNVQQEVDVESLDKMVLIRQTVLQDDIRPPLALTFNEYVQLLQARQMRNYWREYAAQNYSELESSKRGGSGINLEIPVKIKSKTFQKIFGSGTVGLVVTGDIRIQAGLRREDRSEVKTAITRGASTNFKMQQTQRFSVTGKIGDKVTVNVDQDSERAFDFDNNVRLVYQGYDDEVVRRFEAGNISLSLPGTRYVTFSGKNSGLFGLKSEMVLGSLNLTTIASQEKGQSQRLSLTGGATSGNNRIEDYRYLANQYFFLDDDYRRQYRYFDADGNHVLIDSIATPIFPDSIEVYKSAAGYEGTFPDRVIQGQATLDGQPVPPAQFAQDAGAAAGGKFIRLERTEYTVEYELGYIRMNTPLTDDEILAVAYKTVNGQVFGDLNFVRQDTTGEEVINLKLLRDRSPLPTYATYPLAWKHVYSLGSRNISEEGFDIKMLDKPSSGSPQETDQQGTFWVQIFGLDEKDEVGTVGSPDGKVDADINILDLARGELHFRDLTPFDPEGYFVVAGGQVTLRNRLDDNLRTPEIYKETDPTIIRGASKFQLEVETKNRGTEYNLGFNVIEGSEVVTLDGTTLQKGRDYTIDYFSGQLIMLNEQASNPSAQLDISYERNQLFQLEKKTILGMRAEYNLGRDSFIGGTLLYLNESTLDQKVRVGRGPMRNVVWDLNTRLKFQPNFIARGFDAMPFIRAKGETQLNLEGEIAQVMPNPNTLNSTKTDDNNGVAYIDDFESAKKATNLGVLRRNWSLASPPADGRHDHRNKLNNFDWYNPVEQVPITQIFPEREVNPNTGETLTHVLRMDFFDPEDQEPDSTRWGGVMRALSPGFFDQSQTKFIEIMVQGNGGRLHLDMGSISEDVIANKKLDTEDEIEAGSRNTILDEGEDRGLDTVVRVDPPELNYPRTNHVGDTVEQAPYDFWDVNNNGVKDADEPWSYDDWFYPSQSRQYITPGTGSIDGTENSRNDEGGRVPDTEDINANSILDQVNQYFSYSFSLRPDSPDTSLIVGGNDDPNISGGPWKLYRIPFNNEAADTLIGSPSRSLIEYIRIWFDDFDYNDKSLSDQFPDLDRVTIAEINLVGSEWKERGIAGDEFGLTDLESGDSVGDRFSVTQINTFDSPEYAATLDQIGVQGEEDKVTRTRAREQSLVLKSAGTGLDPGKAGIAQKSLFQGENYIRYDRIRMFVYGIDDGMTHFAFMTGSDSTAKSNLEYFVRFGSDDNNYYEYRSAVYPEWDDRNHMDLALLDFTSIERDTSASANGSDITYDDSLGIWIKRISDEKAIIVKGSPSFTNVRRLTLGINNKLDNTPFLGEVWFNELRLSDVQKDRGMAVRARADMRIGSFGTVNAEIERKDDDFHNVATRFGTGNNSLSKSLNANVNVDQVLPQSWGIAMPLSLNFRDSESDPKYFPGLDREVTQADLSDPATLARIQTKTTQTGFNLSFRRQAKSKNFFIKNSLDNMTWSLGRSKNEQHSPTIAESRTTSWTGNFDYRLDFGRNNFFKPLGWLPGLPLVKKAKETKLYFTPQNVSFRVNGTKTDRFSQNRIQNSDQLAEPNETEDFVVDRSARASMKIFENLTVDFNRAHKAQMKDKVFKDFVNWNFEDINKTQALTVRYSPQVFGWLTNNFAYTSNYRWANNLGNQSTGRSANNNITKQGDFNFRWKQLVQSIFGGGSKSTPRRGRPRGRPGTRGGGSGQGGTDRENEFSYFQEKSTGASFRPLSLVKDFFSGLKDIQFTYSERKDNRQSGLSDKDPSTKFQFGLDDETGVATVADLSGTFLTRSNTKNMSVNSGIALARAVDIGLRFQKNDQENNSFQTSGSTATGSASESFLVQDLENGGGVPFPEWNVRIAGLNSLPFFNKIFTNVTFSHALTGQRNESWTGNSGNKTSENFTRNFRPLGKLDLNFKNGFTGNIQVNRSHSLTKTFSNGDPIGASRNTNEDLSITANYSKRSGFRIPFWPFNKAELKNSIDFTFTFTASKVIQENKANINVDFAEANKTTRWSVSPRLTYSFSNTVRGGAFVEVGKTNSKRVGTTKVQEFGIDINIAIRGN